MGLWSGRSECDGLCTEFVERMASSSLPASLGPGTLRAETQARVVCLSGGIFTEMLDSTGNWILLF